MFTKSELMLAKVGGNIDPVYYEPDVSDLGDRTPKKNLYSSSNCDEKLNTHVKSKIKWGNCHERFSIFLKKNELFTENVKEGGSR